MAKSRSLGKRLDPQPGVLPIGQEAGSIQRFLRIDPSECFQPAVLPGLLRSDL